MSYTSTERAVGENPRGSSRRGGGVASFNANRALIA